MTYRKAYTACAFTPAPCRLCAVNTAIQCIPEHCHDQGTRHHFPSDTPQSPVEVRATIHGIAMKYVNGPVCDASQYNRLKLYGCCIVSSTRTDAGVSAISFPSSCCSPNTVDSTVKGEQGNRYCGDDTLGRCSVKRMRGPWIRILPSSFTILA